MRITFWLFLFIPSFLFAQLPLFMSVEMQEAYSNQTRSMDGKPGKNYWQNRGDYDIRVEFNPRTLLLSGEETITYYNNSPDTLDKLIIRLYPDYYKKGIFRNYPVNEKDENEGVTIESLRVNEALMIDGARQLLNIERDETNLIVTPASGILPKSVSTIHVKWRYTVNSGSQNRTGQIDSSTSFIAYFFPRISVYDDLNGWDEETYKGIHEFYNDFGNFNVTISVPGNFLVWATGELQNGNEVYSQETLQKLQKAKTTSDIIHATDKKDLEKGGVTIPKEKNIWNFKAAHVTDFAFAISDHYLWDACSVVADKKTGRRVLIQTAYNKDHQDYYEIIHIAKRCMQIMNDTFPAVPFPYPQITIIDGTDQMEYPMMINDNPTETRKDAVQLTTHEMIHAYFPFYMGTNETEHAWMDEGWATIGESVISPMLGEPEDEGVYRKSVYEEYAAGDELVPLITNSKLLTTEAYYSNSYGMGGLMFWTLRDLLGDEKFFKSLHEFMDRWNGKHPTPYDFFYTFNNTSGENLDWFWKTWFFDWGYTDLGIEDVKKENGKWEIVVRRKGNIPVPIDLTIHMKDGSSIHYRETAAVWKDGKTSHTFSAETKSEIRSVTLGDEFIPDVDRMDNEWKK